MREASRLEADHARALAGVNSNLLAGDGTENTEALSGTSHLSGIEVSVRRSGAGARPGAA